MLVYLPLFLITVFYRFDNTYTQNNRAQIFILFLSKSWLFFLYSFQVSLQYHPRNICSRFNRGYIRVVSFRRRSSVVTNKRSSSRSYKPFERGVSLLIAGHHILPIAIGIIAKQQRSCRIVCGACGYRSLIPRRHACASRDHVREKSSFSPNIDTPTCILSFVSSHTVRAMTTCACRILCSRVRGRSPTSINHCDNNGFVTNYTVVLCGHISL